MCVELSQACDPKGLVALSRLESRIPDFIIPPPCLIDFDDVQQNITQLLRHLLSNCRSPCGKFHTKMALDEKYVSVTSEKVCVIMSTVKSGR